MLQRALDTIRSGGCLIYPTETLYALGAGAFQPEAARRIMALKARAQGKPLPLIIGAKDQLSQITGWMSKTLDHLARSFWPGPLSILVPARRDLPAEVRDPRGLTSVRWTAHPLAARLCVLSGTPLIATSANVSGHPAAARPEELDRALTKEVLVLADKPWPAGGRPSTVVRCLGTDLIEVLRHGAVSDEELLKAGFELVAAPRVGV